MITDIMLASRLFTIINAQFSFFYWRHYRFYTISAFPLFKISFRFLSSLNSSSFEYSFIYLIITNIQCNCQCWIVPDRKQQPEAVFLVLRSGLPSFSLFCSVSISLWLFIVYPYCCLDGYVQSICKLHTRLQCHKYKFIHTHQGIRLY